VAAATKDGAAYAAGDTKALCNAFDAYIKCLGDFASNAAYKTAVDGYRKSYPKCTSSGGTPVGPAAPAIPTSNACFAAAKDEFEKCFVQKPVVELCKASLEKNPAKKPTEVCKDAAKPTLCPDFKTCAENEQGCAKLIKWSGCLPGMVSCPGARLKCVDDLTKCKAETGCDVGLESCGWKRDPKTGRKDGRNCVAQGSCARKAPDPLGEDTKPREASITGAMFKKDKLMKIVSMANKEIMRMKIDKDPFGGADVGFDVGQVPDSDLTTGAFKNVLDKLLSPVISILPTSVVGNLTEPIYLEFPILDEAAQDSVEACNALLAVTTVYSSSNGGDLKKEDGFCTKGEAMADLTCVCKKGVKHFTEFAIAQAEEIGPDTPAPAPAPAPEEKKGLGGGAIAGIIIGCLLGIGALVAIGVVVSKRKAHPNSSKPGVTDVDL
jgi:hypothetical protein